MMNYKNVFKFIVCSFVISISVFIFSHPCSATQKFVSPLLINEIFTRDAYGYNDWIELYVIGNEAVFLGDYSLTDDKEGREPAPLPAISLWPGEFIVIRATDEDSNDGTPFVPFKLGDDDSVILYLDANIVDVLDWADGDAPEGYSYGRLPDGTGDPQTLSPTPNAPNETLLNSALVINEVDPNGCNEGPQPSVIENVSPSNAVQGDMNVLVTITLSDNMAMHPPEILPLSVKIDTLEGSNISRNGLLITALFDIPVNATAGMKDISVSLPLPPMDPNGQAMVITKTAAFEIIRGYIPFAVESTTVDEIVTDIPSIAPGGLYDETILRTMSLEFDQNDWWEQLTTNHNAGQDKNILADLIVDGITYHDVGVRFRGLTSYMTGISRKKSFNISIDEIYPDQRLMGYKTLNLNNCNMDPSFIREVLYFNIFRRYAPCPQANFIKLIINGEDWGIYVNVQQINAALVEEWFRNSDGDRWKVGMGDFQNVPGMAFPDANMQEILFNNWLSTPEAEDLNDDGEITKKDYDIFMNPLPTPLTGDPFILWLESPQADDLDGDGEIMEDDYIIFLNSTPSDYGGPWVGNFFSDTGPPDTDQFNDWLSSPDAQDLDNDGEITEEDYIIFMDTVQYSGGFWGWGTGSFVTDPFDAWLDSPQAEDLNEDDEITEDDYNIFLNNPPTYTPVGYDPNTSGGFWPFDPNIPPGGFWPLDPNMPSGGFWSSDPNMFPGTWWDPNMSTGGWMTGDGALSWSGEDIASYEFFYELKSANTPDPWGNLIALCDILNNTPIEQLADAVDDVMAVDRWLWFLALESIFTDEDSYLTKGADYQLYYDPKTGKFHPLQHDGNETFNTIFIYRNPFEGENYPNRPVIKRLLSIPQFRARYLAHIRAIIEESLDWNALEPQIEAYRALIADEVMADTKKLYSNDQFESSFTEIEDFINRRHNYLLKHPEVNRPALDIYSVARKLIEPDSLSPLPGKPVWIIAYVDAGVNMEQAILYYTAGKGPFEHVSMFFADVPGSAYTGEILVGQIPPFPAGSVIRYYVEVRASDTGESASFSPYKTEGHVFTYRVKASTDGYIPIVINELMASNQTTIQDPQGEYDDWIELLNIGDLEIDLSGMYLSDKEENPLKWEIPSGVTLAPGAYLIIWADEDSGDEPGLHANFKLSAGGETVSLVDRDERGNILIDSVRFGEQEGDVSFGRFPDGTGQFQILSEPTPDAENFTLVSDYDGDGYTISEGDCADDNPAINPWAIEVYDGVDNDCDGFVDEGAVEIENVSPSYAYQGDMDVLVTITLGGQLMLHSDVNLLSVKIGSLEGMSTSFNGLEIMAVFDIPPNEPAGMRDVYIELAPPSGAPTGGQGIIVTKSHAFDIRVARTSSSGSKKTPYNYNQNIPQTWLGTEDLFMPGGYVHTPQVPLGFGQQIWGTPQRGYSLTTQSIMYGYASQTDFITYPQDSFGLEQLSVLTQSGKLGLTPRITYGLGQQGWYTPQGGYGFPVQSLYGYGYIPQTGFGYTSQSGLGLGR